MLLTLIFQLFSLQMLLFNICTFFEDYISPLVLKTVRYGKAGVGIDSSPILFDVPKKWFTHFYIFASCFVSWTLWCYVFKTSLLHQVVSTVVDGQACVPNPTAFLALVLLAAQIYRRLYECLFISKFSDEARMNVAIYLVGFYHYFGAILSIFGGSSGTCVEVNGYSACAAVPLFVFAWVKHLEAHVILANLRQHPTDKSYRIPKGGLFDYVSCANYFAELLIYFSLCLIFQFQNYELNWVGLWVLSNQTYSAAMSHQWYLKKFGSAYPAKRKRLIPFIF